MAEKKQNCVHLPKQMLVHSNKSIPQLMYFKQAEGACVCGLLRAEKGSDSLTFSNPFIVILIHCLVLACTVSCSGPKEEFLLPRQHIFLSLTLISPNTVGKTFTYKHFSTMRTYSSSECSTSTNVMSAWLCMWKNLFKVSQIQS